MYMHSTMQFTDSRAGPRSALNVRDSFLSATQKVEMGIDVPPEKCLKKVCKFSFTIDGDLAVSLTGPATFLAMHQSVIASKRAEFLKKTVERRSQLKAALV